MNQSQKGLLVWIIFLCFIALPSFYGIRMIQQRQQRDRAAVDRMRHVQPTQVRSREQTAGEPRLADKGTIALAPPTALAEFRATVGHAFDALRKQGIVAEPKFEDCVRCAVAAMSDLLDERDAPGGVYWHDQDDERLEQGEDLMIGFVARGDGDAAAIAQKVVAALKAEGLAVDWDGSVERRVTVKVPWASAQREDRHVGKPALQTEPPRVRLERVGHMPSEVGDPIGTLLAVEERLAYLAKGGSILVVDVSDPTRPRVAGSYELAESDSALAVSGGVAYVTGEQKLRIIEFTDPTAPRVVGSCNLGRKFGENAWGVAVQGRYAYVTDGGSVVVVDVSDRAAPKRLGRCEVECGEGITVAGNHAYLPCDSLGVRIVDVSDPRAPKPVGEFRGSAGAIDVTVAGKLAYITGGEDGLGLCIVDISVPRQPRQIGRYGDGMTGGVAVQGDYAYLAGGHLDVVDISNPAAPKLVGFYRDDECLTAWRVVVAGNHVYVTGEGKQGFSILQTVWADREP